MCRVLTYLVGRAQWWLSKQEARKVEDITIAEGICTYCVCQALLQRQIYDLFQTIQKAPLDDSVIMADQEEDEDGDEDEDEDSYIHFKVVFGCDIIFL